MNVCPTGFKPFKDENGEPSNKKAIKLGKEQVNNSLDLIDHVATKTFGDIVDPNVGRMAIKHVITKQRNIELRFQEQHGSRLDGINKSVETGKALDARDTMSYIEMKAREKSKADFEAGYKQAKELGLTHKFNPEASRALFDQAMSENRLKVTDELTEKGHLSVDKDGNYILNNFKIGEVKKINAREMDVFRTMFKPLSEQLDLMTLAAGSKKLSGLDEQSIAMVNKFNYLNLSEIDKNATRQKVIKLGLLGDSYRSDDKFIYKAFTALANWGKSGAVGTSFANAAQTLGEHGAIMRNAFNTLARDLDINIQKLNETKPLKEDAAWYNSNKSNFGIVADDLSGLSGSEQFFKSGFTGKLGVIADMPGKFATLAQHKAMMHLRNEVNQSALKLTRLQADTKGFTTGSKEWNEAFSTYSAYLQAETMLSHKELIAAPNFGGKAIFNIDSLALMVDGYADKLLDSGHTGAAEFTKGFSDNVLRTFTGWYHESMAKQIAGGKTLLKGDMQSRMDAVGNFAMMGTLLGSRSLAPIAIVSALTGIAANVSSGGEVKTEEVNQHFDKLNIMNMVYPELMSNINFDKNNLSPTGIVAKVIENAISPVGMAQNILAGDFSGAEDKVAVFNMLKGKLKGLKKVSKNHKDGVYEGDPVAFGLDTIDALLQLTSARGTMNTLKKSGAALAGGVMIDSKMVSDITQQKIATPFDGYGDRFDERVALALFTLMAGQTNYERDAYKDFQRDLNGGEDTITERINSGNLF